VVRFFSDNRTDAGNKITFMNAVKPIIEDLIPAKEIEERIKKE
jgi:hypothetical protein